MKIINLLRLIDVFELIRTRRSIRRYGEELVERDKIEKVLEAARLSPSTLNFTQRPTSPR